MYKKACTCRVTVLLVKPVAFLTFSVPSPSSFPKVPIRAGVSRDFMQLLDQRRRRHLKNTFAFLCCDHSSMLKLSNAGELSRSEFLRSTSKLKGERQFRLSVCVLGKISH